MREICVGCALSSTTSRPGLGLVSTGSVPSGKGRGPFYIISICRLYCNLSTFGPRYLGVTSRVVWLIAPSKAKLWPCCIGPASSTNQVAATEDFLLLWGWVPDSFLLADIVSLLAANVTVDLAVVDWAAHQAYSRSASLDFLRVGPSLLCEAARGICLCLVDVLRVVYVYCL